MKTIKMKREDWEKWDAALRSGTYNQGAGELFNQADNAYCCLGVLQHALEGAVTPDHSDEVPSFRWLLEHDIAFFNRRDEESRMPYLPTIGEDATVANDALDYSNSEARHRYDFVKIADAIKDAVEFIDA